MGYRKASPADVESVVDPDDGGLWFLKGPLETRHLGFSVREMEPGTAGKRHDHAHDGQEEIYYVVDGTLEVEVGDDVVTLERDDALRVDAEETRQLHNRSDGVVRLVVAGAPLRRGA